MLKDLWAFPGCRSSLLNDLWAFPECRSSLLKDLWAFPECRSSFLKDLWAFPGCKEFLNLLDISILDQSKDSLDHTDLLVGRHRSTL